MKTFILKISLLFIVLSNFSCTDPVDQEDNNELIKYFLEQGITDSITKNQFVDIVDFFLTKSFNKTESDKIGMREFIPQNIQHVPEKFPKDDISMYITQDLLLNIMKSQIESKHSGHEAEALKKQLDSLRDVKKEDL